MNFQELSCENCDCKKVIITRQAHPRTVEFRKTWFSSYGWLVGFYGVSTFVGYLTPNPFLCK